MVSARDFQAALGWRGDGHVVLLGWLGFAALCLGTTFLILSQTQGTAAAVGIGGLTVMAAVAIGGVVGFLFALPRVLSSDTGRESAEATSDPSESKPETRTARLLGSNTNLERISEWLTTMLVGVGLTQIASIPDHMERLTAFVDRNFKVFASDAGPIAGALPGLIPVLLCYGLVLGFLFLYLYTRIYLSNIFLQVEVILSQVTGQEPLPISEGDFLSEAAALAELHQDPAMEYLASARNLSINQALEVVSNALDKGDAGAAAIKLGRKLASTPATHLGHYWFSMAAAFGQRHRHLLASGGSPQEITTARKAIINAARHAVRISPRWKARLKELTDPDALDNDLATVRDDPKFLRVIA